MLQPIDQPSPLKAARAVQKLPPCGQARPSLLHTPPERATHNSELEKDFARKVPRGSGKRGARRRPEEWPALPLHPNFSPRWASGQAREDKREGASTTLARSGAVASNLLQVQGH